MRRLGKGDRVIDNSKSSTSKSSNDMTRAPKNDDHRHLHPSETKMFRKKGKGEGGPWPSADNKAPLQCDPERHTVMQTSKDVKSYRVPKQRRGKEAQLFFASSTTSFDLADTHIVVPCDIVKRCLDKVKPHNLPVDCKVEKGEYERSVVEEVVISPAGLLSKCLPLTNPGAARSVQDRRTQVNRRQSGEVKGPLTEARCQYLEVALLRWRPLGHVCSAFYRTCMGSETSKAGGEEGAFRHPGRAVQLLAAQAQRLVCLLASQSSTCRQPLGRLLTLHHKRVDWKNTDCRPPSGTSLIGPRTPKAQ